MNRKLIGTLVLLVAVVVAYFGARVDEVAFQGGYESTHQGGVRHQTHRDPPRGHAEGWLRQRGRTYR